jgi:hypothetical protein
MIKSMFMIVFEKQAFKSKRVFFFFFKFLSKVCFGNF